MVHEIKVPGTQTIQITSNSDVYFRASVIDIWQGGDLPSYIADYETESRHISSRICWYFNRTVNPREATTGRRINHESGRLRARRLPPLFLLNNCYRLPASDHLIFDLMLLPALHSVNLSRYHKCLGVYIHCLSCSLLEIKDLDD